MKKLNTENGVQAHEVYKVFQDSKQYIWFASDAGLWRFDGKEYQNYTTVNGLPDNTIFGFFEDSKQKIWLKTYNHKIGYIENEKIVTLPCSNKLFTNFKTELIASLYVDKADTIYISYFASNFYTKIAPPYTNDLVQTIAINSKASFYIIELYDGNILVGSNNIHYSTNTIEIINKKQTSIYNINNTIPNGSRTCSIKQNNGSYLIGFNNCLFSYNKGILKIIKCFQTAILDALYDNQNNLWVATIDKGLYFFSHNDKYLENPELYFSKDFANGIIQDKEESYWIATLKGGLYYLPYPDLQFINQDNGLTENISCTYFNPASSYVYCFAENGMMYTFSNNKTINTTDLSLNKQTPNTIYNAILLDKNKLLCIGRQSLIYNLITNKKTPITNLNYKYPIHSSTLFKYNDIIYLSEYTRLAIYDIKKSTFSVVADIKSKINYIYPINNDSLLIATEKGLACYLNSSNTIIFPSSFPNNSSLIGITQSPLFPMAYLIIEKGGKIYTLNKKFQIINEKIIEPNGISVRNFFTDKKGKIWLSTNRGIYNVENDFNVSSIQKINGLPSNLINHINEIKGKIFASTEDGLIIFNSTKSFKTVNCPKLYCTEIQINDSVQPIKPIYNLNYKENFIKIKFIGLNYRNNGNLIYKYNMSGVDTNWHITNQNSITFTTLPPGTYNFKLNVFTIDGLKGKTQLNFCFIIAPPFWETWWFIILGIILLSIIIIFGIKIREHQIKKHEREKAETDKQIISSEMQALRSQMNPHFIFNSINAIQHHILTNEPLIANKYLTKFSKLIRNILEQSRSEYIPLSDELETIHLYLEMESLRFEDKFIYTFPDYSNAKYKTLMIPPLIFQPIIENAIWHGLLPKKGNKELNISLKINNNTIEIVIDDNGVGRNNVKIISTNSLKKESLGIKITKQRLELIQESSQIKSGLEIVDKFNQLTGLSEGTKVKITLPIQFK